MRLSLLCSSWAVGIVGKGDAGGAGGNNASLGRSVWESYGRHVQPFSLYLAQKDGLDLHTVEAEGSEGRQQDDVIRIQSASRMFACPQIPALAVALAWALIMAGGDTNCIYI